MNEAHDLLVELVAVLKTIPAEHTDDYQDLGSRIQAYLGGGGRSMNVQQSKKGLWWIGPMPKADSRWRYIGPYERKADAESDRVGITRFLKREGE